MGVSAYKPNAAGSIAVAHRYTIFNLNWFSKHSAVWLICRNVSYISAPWKSSISMSVKQICTVVSSLLLAIWEAWWCHLFSIVWGWKNFFSSPGCTWRVTCLGWAWHQGPSGLINILSIAPPSFHLKKVLRKYQGVANGCKSPLADHWIYFWLLLFLLPFSQASTIIGTLLSQNAGKSIGNRAPCCAPMLHCQDCRTICPATGRREALKFRSGWETQDVSEG